MTRQAQQGGTHRVVDAVNGTRADWLDLGKMPDSPNRAWTVCVMARYHESPSWRHEVVRLQGPSCNAYIGHYGSKNGRVFIENWLSPHNDDCWPLGCADWTLTCAAWDHSVAGSPDYAYVNGQNRKTEYDRQAHSTCNGDERVYVNVGKGSDWMLSEVRVWPRQLEPGEIMQISREMMEATLGAGCGPCDPGEPVTARCTATANRTCDTSLRQHWVAEVRRAQSFSPLPSPCWMLCIQCFFQLFGPRSDTARGRTTTPWRASGWTAWRATARCSRPQRCRTRRSRRATGRSARRCGPWVGGRTRTAPGPRHASGSTPSGTPTGRCAAVALFSLV